MKDWKRIAEAYGLALTARELDRIAPPMAALEETFRPLTCGLKPDLEPDVELHLLHLDVDVDRHRNEDGE